MNDIAEIRQNIDDFEKFKNGIKKFFDKVDEGGQEVSTINNWFSFLSKYSYKASCGFGKGKLSRYPFIVFIRTDSGYQSASKGVYCRVNIKRNTDEISVEINESKNNKITYKAKQDCRQYNENKSCKFKRNDLDDIVEQVLKDMEWFAELPLESIKDNVVTITKPQDDANSQPDIDSTKGENMATPPLNQILYGPPGTGKTYKTINKALEILGEQIEGRDRAELKAKFDEYRQNGQIEFVTFHQSFSYEEFVEGIKPNVENEKMTYAVKDGIFKEICIKAQENLRQANIDDGQIDAGEVFDRYAEKVQEQLTKEETISFGKNNVKVVGVVDFKNNANAGLRCTTSSGKTPIWITRAMVLRDYDNYKNGTIKEAKDIVSNHTGKKHAQSWWYLDFYAELKKFEEDSNIRAKKINKEPYILIIDEINRGNISKILGELITLIEPSKRIGANEELRVTLPYSGNEFDNGKGFGVPNNLYIIGTMNTADRSIALLDTALRRRFEFVEMMPECKELQKIWLVNEIGKKDSSIEPWEGEKGDDEIYHSKVLFQMLTAINNRIEFLLDREHTIGHAFFFEKAQFYKTIYNENNLSESEQGEWYELSLDSLKEIFAKKIIPLLQEYFYDDYAKIRAVLNDNDMIQPKPKPEFLSKFSDEVNDEKVVYEIEKEWQKWESWQFVKIYNSKATKPQSQDSNKSDAK